MNPYGFVDIDWCDADYLDENLMGEILSEIPSARMMSISRENGEILYEVNMNPYVSFDVILGDAEYFEMDVYSAHEYAV